MGAQQSHPPSEEPTEEHRSAPVVPLDKLTKLLVQQSQKDDGVNGVTEKSIIKFLFPQYPHFGEKFFSLARRNTATKTAHIPSSAFRAHCEKLMCMLDEARIIAVYVDMFSARVGGEVVCGEELRELVHASYLLSMDHYPDGPRSCLHAPRTLAAVVRGCFRNKSTHTAAHVSKWLHEQCPRLVLPLHRYVVHALTTRHRAADADDLPLGLATPVLDRDVCSRGDLLPLSGAWLVAGAAPPLYSSPRTGPRPSPASMSGRAWLARLLCVAPSHWQRLYWSRDHGRGSNRFLHHTLGYRGPTVVVVAAGERRVAVCSSKEWRDTHRYQGDKDCLLILLEPTFEVLERGPNMLYLNSAARGYPRGLRAGSDPREPLLEIDEHFDTVRVQDTAYPLDDIEVWGCGDEASREIQLDIKKWQVREAERQSKVKLSAADWQDHPDRYLLELAGRPTYST